MRALILAFQSLPRLRYGALGLEFDNASPFLGPSSVYASLLQIRVVKLDLWIRADKVQSLPAMVSWSLHLRNRSETS